MYLIIGSHTHGRWALYIGTLSQLGRRIRTHALCVRVVRKHNGSNHQYCHKILGGDEWSVTYHNIVVFKKAISIIWLHTIETIFILLFNAMDNARPKSRQHNEACARLYDRLVQNALRIVSTIDKDKAAVPPPPIDAGDGCQSAAAVSPPLIDAGDGCQSAVAVPPPPIDAGGQLLDPPIIIILRLNRCLPIKQGFRGSPSTFKRICEQCQAEYTTRSWYWYDITRPFESYRCENCYAMDTRKDTRNATRTEAHQQRLDKLREVREKLPVADKCGSCGTTESPGFTRCVELGMVLCNREHSYWQRNGELSPTNTGIGEERETIKAMFPTLDKCGSCGTTEGSFNRCKEAGMVLCKREYKYWQVLYMAD